jgi:hypothetical protein
MISVIYDYRKNCYTLSVIDADKSNNSVFDSKETYLFLKCLVRSNLNYIDYNKWFIYCDRDSYIQISQRIKATAKFLDLKWGSILKENGVESMYTIDLESGKRDFMIVLSKDYTVDYKKRLTKI